MQNELSEKEANMEELLEYLLKNCDLKIAEECRDSVKNYLTESFEAYALSIEPEVFIGQDIWVIRENKENEIGYEILEGYVSKYSKTYNDNYRICVYCDKEKYYPSFVSTNIGKKLFLSREDAENYLRDKNK